MTLRNLLRWCAIAIVAMCVAAALNNRAEAQKSSPKELLKDARTDEEHQHWDAALQKLQTAAALKRKNKAIAEELQQVRAHMADLTANRAMASCNDLKLDACERQVKLALSYMRTSRATEAASRLAVQKAQLEKRWDMAEQMIASHQLEKASAELESLSQFSYLFPTLTAEKLRLRGLRISADIALGSQEVADGQFDDAKQAFGAALHLDPNNANAIHGIETAQKGKEAFGYYEHARNAFSTKSYEVAYLTDQKALGLFPDQPEYNEFSKQISAAWLKVLEDPSELSPSPASLKDNQAAWERLKWIERLDPHYYEGLTDATRKIRGNLWDDYNQEAHDYQSWSNNSGTGLAYLYYLNAQELNPDPTSESPFSASFSEVRDLFVRKRTMIVVVSVVNLIPGSSSFSDVVAHRVRAAIEDLGVPDLKVLSLDDYKSNSSVDPLFQTHRPAGKSRMVAFDVEVTSYESESTGNDKPEDKPSQFESGVEETVSNPEYEKALQRYQVVKKALERKHKPGKPTKEGYMPTDLDLAEHELEQTPQTITRHKVVDYHYQEYHLRTTARIALKLELRDMLQGQLTSSDEVESTQQDIATEIAGVQPKDVNGFLNQPSRMRTSEQLLRDAELDALKTLDKKVPTLLAPYLDRYYAEGEQALSERRIGDAAENFICYWYTFSGHMDKGRAQQIQEVVKQYTGLDMGTSDSLPALP